MIDFGHVGEFLKKNRAVFFIWFVMILTTYNTSVEPDITFFV